jgi:hypothetical protein
MAANSLAATASRRLAVFALTVMLLLFTSPGWAAPPNVTLEIVPHNLALFADHPSEVRLVLGNNGDSTISNISLTWFTDLPLNVDVVSPEAKAVPPGGALTIPVKLATDSSPAAEGPVHFQVTYTWSDAASGDVQNTVLTTLQVTKSRRPQTSEVLEVEVQSSGTTVNEKRPLTLYLILSNLSAGPINVTQIQPSGPAFMAFEPGQLDKPVAIRAGQSLSVPFTATPNDAIIPGDHLLFFDVGMAWQDADQTLSGNRFLSTKVRVESFGEPEMLNLLGVPSFYVLPGFLMVVTLGLLWRASKPGRQFPLSAASPEFWLVAISLSIGIALAYPLVTGRDYLTGYDLRDVVQIWLSSIILAAAAFIVTVGGANLIGRYLDWRRRRHLAWLLPAAGDEPVTVLRKLHRQGLGVFLERVELDIEGERHFAYLYQKRPETWEKLWVGPAIVVEWLQGANVDLRRRVGEQLEENGSALKLAELLMTGQEEGDLRTYYRGTMDGPILAGREEATAFLPANIVVEEE